jgi:hypothetical protein
LRIVVIEGEDGVNIQQKSAVQPIVEVRDQLNTRNVTTIGSVAAAGTLGRVLSALPGRSVRTFSSID